jgi:uncharacterized protein YciI
MKFAAVIEYTPDREKTEGARPAHRQYLRDLLAKGQLAVAGPFTDGPGALIVYEVATAEEAEALLKADPFCQAGVFVRWQVRPWNVVFTNRELFPGT